MELWRRIWALGFPKWHYHYGPQFVSKSSIYHSYSDNQIKHKSDLKVVTLFASSTTNNMIRLLHYILQENFVYSSIRILLSLKENFHPCWTMLEHREVPMNIVSEHQKCSSCRHNVQVKLSHNFKVHKSQMWIIITSTLHQRNLISYQINGVAFHLNLSQCYQVIILIVILQSNL